MKSFRFKRPAGDDKLEVIALLIGMAIVAGLYAALDSIGLANFTPKVFALMLTPIFVIHLFRGGLKQIARSRYPSAKHIWLLGIAAASFSSWGIAQICFPEAEQGWIALGFILPSIGAIVAFLVINRHDPDVMQ